MTPQINRLGETSTVLRVSTHIFGVCKEIDGKNVHFKSKPRHVTPHIDCLRKKKDIAGKTCIFQLNLGM